MHALALLPLIALAAASPLQTSTIDPCEFASPCINPNAPCPCPEKWATPTVTPVVIESRDVEPIDCHYKCPPCEEGQRCRGNCDPLPLDPRCSNRCDIACKPCREGSICPALCLPVTLPTDCPATPPPPPENDTCKFKCAPCEPGKKCPALCNPLPLPPQCPNQCDIPECKLCRNEGACPKICKKVTVARPIGCPVTYPPSPAVEARAAEPVEDKPDCVRKCADDASGICDPLPLPEYCPNRCEQSCRLCKGEICSRIKFPCLPITLPAECAATSAPTTLEARAAEEDAAVPACDLICKPCREGEECSGLCDVFDRPKWCRDRCDQACKPCREGANCPKICLPITLPADCPAPVDDKPAPENEDKNCDPNACWMPPCPPGHACTQQCQTPPWCQV